MSNSTQSPEQTAVDRTNSPPRTKWSLAGLLTRLAAWWMGLFALLGGTGGICPFCGRPGCFGGSASNGFLAGMAALVLTLSGGIRRVTGKPPQASDGH